MPPRQDTLAQPVGRRVLVIAPCPFPSYQGTQVLIRHQVTALVEHNDRIDLVTYNSGGDQYRPPNGVYWHRAPGAPAGLRSGPSFGKPLADARLARYALGIALKQRSDVLHVHNIEGLITGLWLRRKTGLPLVYHAHNAMGLELPTYFESRPLQRAARLLGLFADRQLPKQADRVVVLSDDARGYYESVGVLPNKLRVHTPKLDTQELQPTSASTLEAKALGKELGPGPWLLYAGNPDTYQNLPLLWEAFAIAKQTYPTLQLLIATHLDPSAFAPTLENAPSLEGIKIHRYQNMDSLRAIFAITDVGVCPRTMPVGVPIKVLNYEAVGLPVALAHANDTPMDFAQSIVQRIKTHAVFHLP